VLATSAVIANCGSGLPEYSHKDLIAIQAKRGYVTLHYDLDKDNNEDVFTVRKWHPDGKVSEPFLIFWDKNGNGTYDSGSGEVKMKKGWRDDVEAYRGRGCKDFKKNALTNR
jgi:hypothetical protein